MELNHLYKSITADKSQLCDGRSTESLSKMLEDLQIERRSSSSNNLLSHTVSCNNAGGEIRSHMHELSPYHPVSLRTSGGRKTATREMKFGPAINESAGLEISPDDANAISKDADWFNDDLHLQRRPPKMPFDSIEAQSSDAPKNNETCIKVAESSPVRRTYRRSSSLPPEIDLEMWKTGQSNALSPPVKQRKKHEFSQDARQAKSDNIPHVMPSSSYHTPPSKLFFRKKHTPQHRSPQVNQTLSSIMKPPKYPPRNRAQSMPPLGPLPDLLFEKRPSTTTASDSSTDSNWDSDAWIPKGVDFQNNAEVYFFKK
jgi:hypothetical protein